MRDLMLALLTAAQLGKRVALLDYVAPSPHGEWKFVEAVCFKSG